MNFFLNIRDAMTTSLIRLTDFEFIGWNFRFAKTK